MTCKAPTFPQIVAYMKYALNESVCVLNELCLDLISSNSINYKMDVGDEIGKLGQLISDLDIRVSEYCSEPITDYEGEAFTEELDFHGFLEYVDSNTLHQIEADLVRRFIGLRRAYRKCRKVDRLIDYVKRDDCLFFEPEFKLKANNNSELFHSEEQLQTFYFYVLVDVEISAMEVCGQMILESPDMPVAFFADLSRQIWDESRHARFFYGKYLSVGGELGKHGYTNSVLTRFSVCNSLIEKLICQQLIQEGNAVEVNVDLAKHLEPFDKETSSAIYMINNDEAMHVRIGNKWIDFLVSRDSLTAEDLFETMLTVSEVIELDLFGKGKWNPDIRKAVGFSDWFVEVGNKYFD